MISSRPSSSFRSRTDARVALVLAVLAGAAALIALLVLGFLLREAQPLLHDGGWRALLSGDGWHPLEGHFGLSPMFWATVLAAAGAILVAAPLGLASAVFERFYAGRSVQRLHRAMLGLLAGVPSVVYGLWGLTVIVPLIADRHPPGASLLAAILILALMILPTIALTSSSALAAVSPSWLQGAAALGLPRRAVILGVAIPAARGGILAGVLLAIARALGETMAVLMVSGNVVQVPGSVFEPVRVLTANIALEMAYATGTHRAGLFASGLALATLVLALAVVGARLSRSPRHA